MPQIIPAVKTPLTLEQAATAFLQGWRWVLHQDPKPEGLACVVAQSALETGHWKQMYCNEFGNKKAGDSYGGLATMYPCGENVTPAQALVAHRLCPAGVVSERPVGGGLVELKLVPPHPWTRFRAWRTAADGAAAQIRFLALDTNGGGNRYGAAWDAMAAGDARRAALELKRAGYYTGPADAYCAAMESIARKVFPLCRLLLTQQPEPDVPDDPITDEDRSHVEQLVAVTLWEMSR